jgi:CRISPR-associated endonuclease/helicase Cas3
LFPHISTPTPLQQWAADFPFDGSPSLFIVEDVTGSGKTEAALILANCIMSANGARGLFIALPTMATSNQMFERLAKSYRRLFGADTHPSLVLAHGAADVHDQFQHSILLANTSGDDDYEHGKTRADTDESISSECNAWFADARRKAFLADVGVGTVDQVFLGVLHSRFQALRLFGLGSKVLVVDEVHANDTYMHSILREVLAFHAARGGSAILLSATLPATMRRELAESFRQGLRMRNRKEPPRLPERDAPAPYPLATVVSGASVTEQPLATRPDVARTVQVKFIPSPNDVPDLIVEEALAGRAVCWIRNTVHDAVEAYKRLSDCIPADKLHLFHARFALCDRKRIEEQALGLFGKSSTPSQRKGRVLIATQVVEQSLDLDFDVLITDLAPIDLVIQRAGRLRRHRRLADGTLITDDTTPDGRPKPVMLYVVSPDPDSDITRTWYADVFPIAKAVYPNHDELWRTAHVLKRIGCISMPDGARHLIEAVYGDTDVPVPTALAKLALDHEATTGAHKSLARTNVLKLRDGYKKTWQSWVDDLITPTRLGDATTTLRLALYRER